jgi:hypothetical protein
MSGVDSTHSGWSTVAVAAVNTVMNPGSTKGEAASQGLCTMDPLILSCVLHIPLT